MPNTFANPWSPQAYESPIAKVFGSLSQSLSSGKSQAQRVKEAEEAVALKRKREGGEGVASAFNLYNKPGFDRNALASAAATAGYDPGDLGAMERYLAANTYGALDKRTDNAFVGAGGAYSSTGGGFTTDQNRQERQHGATLAETRRSNDMTSADRRYGTDVGANVDLIQLYETEAEKARQFNQKPQPALVDGIPSFVPQTDTFKPGTAPILSETDQKGTLIGQNWSNLSQLDPMQRRIVGADAAAGGRAPFNVRRPDGSIVMTTDGMTDLQGNPIPADAARVGIEGTPEEAGLTKSTKTKMEQGNIARDNLRGILQKTRDAIGASPDINFGLTGAVKGFVQDSVVIANNVAKGFGFDAPDDMIKDFQQMAKEKGVDATLVSGVFDPRLRQMQTLYGVLVYATASALADQSGRDLSNEDVKRAFDIVGDPQGWWSNKQSLLSKLDVIEDLVGLQQQTSDKFSGSAPGGAPPMQGARRAPDGNWYVSDPNRPGKYLRVEQ